MQEETKIDRKSQKKSFYFAGFLVAVGVLNFLIGPSEPTHSSTSSPSIMAGGISSSSLQLTQIRYKIRRAFQRNKYVGYGSKVEQAFRKIPFIHDKIWPTFPLVF